jgi:uncharacterized membrane protein YebE (DUF533 family)
MEFRTLKKKTKRIAKKIGKGAGIVGGVVAAGYAAKKLLRNHDEETPEAKSHRDARDVVGDPSAQTATGRESGGGI